MFIDVTHKVFVSHTFPMAAQSFLPYSSSSFLGVYVLVGHQYCICLGGFGTQPGSFQSGSVLLLIFKSWQSEEVSLINFGLCHRPLHSQMIISRPGSQMNSLAG